MFKNIARIFFVFLPKSLSGQLIILTILSVMLVEILILVPSMARFRENYLKDRLAFAQIISLNILASDKQDADFERQLLEEAGVSNIVLHQDQTRRLILQSPSAATIDVTYDLRNTTRWQLVRDAVIQVFERKNRYIRVIDHPAQGVGVLVDVQMNTAGLQMAMRSYIRDIMILSLIIATFAAFIIFLSLRYLFVRPLARLVENISTYMQKPEDVRSVIRLQATSNELRQAEEALLLLEKQLTKALRQKNHLAELGTAVAKISHDLRNILAVAQILADGLQRSKGDFNPDDAGVKRALPKLMATLTRAINLCEATLVFGKAEEASPKLAVHLLSQIVREVIGEVMLLAGEEAKNTEFVCALEKQFTIRCDREQLRRILFNLVDNARKASLRDKIKITISAEEDKEEWRIYVDDTGAGIPKMAQENLFVAFKGGATKGGTGLGLTISAELARGHGGRLELLETGAKGTRFVIIFPKKLRG